MISILFVPGLMLQAQSAHADAQENVHRPLLVLSSIKPLQLIVAALTGELVSEGVIENQALLPPGASPHDYALRFSDAGKLNNADLVIWVGADLEMFLQRPLSRLPAIRTLSVYSPETMDQHHHDDRHEQPHTDLHPWLSPLETRHLAQNITARLILLLPAQETYLLARLALFKRMLAALELRYQTLLRPLNTVGFIVLHDAYRGFVEHFSLNQVGIVTPVPGRKPGMRHIQELKQRVATGQVQCVFKEPQSQAQLLDVILAGKHISVAELDPLATQESVTADAYLRYLDNILSTVVLCLGSSPSL
jgi:zinc transport system substrate-binding protein